MEKNYLWIVPWQVRKKNLDSVLILLFVVSERLKLELRPVIGSFDEEKVVFVLTCTRDVARTNYSKQSVRISIAVFIKRRTRYCPKDFLASEPCLNPCCKLKYLGLNPCSAHFSRSFLERWKFSDRPWTDSTVTCLSQMTTTMNRRWWNIIGLLLVCNGSSRKLARPVAMI